MANVPEELALIYFIVIDVMSKLDSTVLEVRHMTGK